MLMYMRAETVKKHYQAYNFTWKSALQRCLIDVSHKGRKEDIVFDKLVRASKNKV